MKCGREGGFIYIAVFWDVAPCNLLDTDELEKPSACIRAVLWNVTLVDIYRCTSVSEVLSANDMGDSRFF
jgi:hypothetical protein